MNLNLIRRKNFHVYNEPIEMRYIPQAFLWHGHCYRVHAIERCWTVLKRRQHGRRLCFEVHCAEGTFEVHQDLATNTWHLSRARWREKGNAR